MDVALVGAGHVVCMIQHDDDDVGELYFQGFVYAICFGFCVSQLPPQATNQPTRALKYACSLPKAEEQFGKGAMFTT